MQDTHTHIPALHLKENLLGQT